MQITINYELSFFFSFFFVAVCKLWLTFQYNQDTHRIVQMLEMQLAAEKKRNEHLQEQQTILRERLATAAANRDLAILFRELRGWIQRIVT